MKKTIQHVKDLYQKRLLSTRGVVSVGLGNGDDGAPCIIVGITEHSTDIEATVQEILGNHPLKLIVTGTIKPL